MSTLRIQYVIDGAGNVVKSFQDVTGAMNQQEREIQDLLGDYRQLQDELDKTGRKKRELADRMGLLEKAYDRGAISQAEFRKGTVLAIKDFIGFDAILRGLATAAAVGLGAVAAGVAAAIENADKLDELSAKVGIGSEKLSAWGYAAKMTGGDLGTLDAIIPKLARKIADAADPASAAGKLFRQLGIDALDANGKLRTVEQVLPDLADRFKALKDSTAEQALAQELFGRSSADMLEFLKLGSEGFSMMEDKARSLGVVLSDETTANATRFKDELDNLKEAGNGVASQIAAGLLPQMTELTKAASAFTSDAEAMKIVVDLAVFSFAALKEIISPIIGSMYSLGEGASTAIGEISKLLHLTASEPLVLPTGQAAVDAGGKPGRQRRGGAAMMLYEPPPLNFTPSTGGGTRSSRSSGKSDAQREAEQLQKAYEALTARQNERLAALNEEIDTGRKVGEAWQIAYDTQFGALRKLAPAQKEERIRTAEAIDQATAQLEAKKKLAQETARARERMQAVIDDLRAEYEAIGLSNEQLEIRNNLQRAGVTATSELGQQIVKQTQLMQDMRKVVGAMDGLRDAGERFLVDLPKNASEAWKNFLTDLESMLLQWAAKGIIEQVFGQMGTTGQGTPGGSLLGNIFGGFFGGTGGTGGSGTDFIGGLFSSFFGGGRAAGGPIDGGRYGKYYDILERGQPEVLQLGMRRLLMVPPNMQGTVTPADMGGGQGGSFSPTYHFHLGAPTEVRTQQQIAARAAFESKRAYDRNR